jgi:hypothetical protein
MRKLKDRKLNPTFQQRTGTRGDTLMKILMIIKDSHPTGKQHQIKHDGNLKYLSLLKRAT